MSILFKDIVFGPVNSRRLGKSLGVNPLPITHKLCSFNCIYCECGWTKHRSGERSSLPERAKIQEALVKRLISLGETGQLPDAITFAGNGEPTLHPDFAGIAADTLDARDRYAPESLVAILSNSTTLHRPDVVKALTRFDRNILKLDCGTNEMFQLINQPGPSLDLDRITDQLSKFNGNVIIQTLFLRGRHQGKKIDNTTPAELEAWLERLGKISPDQVMLYSLDREPPEKELEQVSVKELEVIADRVRQTGIPAEVY